MNYSNHTDNPEFIFYGMHFLHLYLCVLWYDKIEIDRAVKSTSMNHFFMRTKIEKDSPF